MAVPRNIRRVSAARAFPVVVSLLGLGATAPPTAKQLVSLRADVHVVSVSKTKEGVVLLRQTGWNGASSTPNWEVTQLTLDTGKTKALCSLAGEDLDITQVMDPVAVAGVAWVQCRETIQAAVQGQRPPTKRDGRWIPWKQARKDGWRFRKPTQRVKRWRLMKDKKTVWRADLDPQELPDSFEVRPEALVVLLGQTFLVYNHRDTPDYGSDTRWARVAR